MTFEEWIKSNFPDYRPEIDSEVICEVGMLKSLYEAGFKAGRKDGIENYDLAREGEVYDD